jgi:cleavage stimulation factor subunit 3
MISILLTFATSEVEEERKNFADVHTLFTNLLEQLSRDIDVLTETIAREVIVAKGPEIPRPQGEGMDIDGEGPQARYNALSDEREERGRLVQERRGREVEELAMAMGVVWVMYMRYTRRAEVSWSHLSACTSNRADNPGHQGCTSNLWESEKIGACDMAHLRGVR